MEKKKNDTNEVTMVYTIEITQIVKCPITADANLFVECAKETLMMELKENRFIDKIDILKEKRFENLK